ncbi:MAG: type pilus assembly related protein [Proteobacteria bacterium]|nr:type pilus assembly related protein [Pseudomonadota bacterium]
MKTLRGFSLVELMVGIAIFSILAALAAPSFSAWIVNAKIRTTAESIQTGLQIARTEAVKRNTTVRFQLISSTDNTCAPNANGPHWVVSMDDVTNKCGTSASDTTDPRIIQLRNRAEGSDNKTTVAAGQSSFAFNGMGRPTAVPTAIAVENLAADLCLPGGRVRCLRIEVKGAGQIRMCDPALPATDTQGC